MHIGIEGHGFWGEGGSQTRYAYQLIRALARIDHVNQYTVFFNSLRRQLPGQDWFRDSLNNPNFSYVMSRVPNTGSPWLKRLRSRVIWPWIGRRLGIECFHSTAQRMMYSGRARSVLTVHDVAGLFHPEYYPATRVTREQNRTVVKDMRRADVVLASSQHTQADILRLLALPSERVRPVLLGVDQDQFHPVRDQASIARVKDKYGIHGPYLLHVGDLVFRKNLTRLVQIYARLKKERNIPHQLVLAGKRNYGSKDLYELPASIGVGTDVLFPGFVDERDLPALYSGATVFAYPSLYEGFGLPLLEAMACGVPIVCSSASCLVEVVGDAAIVLDPADDDGWYQALDRVVRREDVRLDLSERGPSRVKEFSWDRTAAQTLSAYRMLGAA